MRLEVDEEALAQAAQLDGCYVLKSDLPADVAHKKTIHDRYKDLAEVECAFRTMKTGHLEVRPVYVRTAANTRGHVFVVMLSYLMVRELHKAWASFDLTVPEGLDLLKNLCAVELKLKNGGSCLRLPTHDRETKNLLEALDIKLPDILPRLETHVDTHRKLPSRRKVK